jgi:hypothetical protein
MSLYHPTLQGVWKYYDKRLSIVLPSENLRHSNDATKYIYNTSATKAKEITNGIRGKWRVKFQLYSYVGGATAYAQIYRNGSAYGLSRATTSSTPVTYTEDLFFDVADLIQLYAYTDNADFPAVVQNFRLYGDIIDAIAYNTLT